MLWMANVHVVGQRLPRLWVRVPPLSARLRASHLVGVLPASLELRDPITLNEPHVALVEDMRAALCHEEVLGPDVYEVVETGQETIGHRLARGNELDECCRVEQPEEIIDEL